MRDPSDSSPKPAGPNPAPGAPVAAAGGAVGVAPPPDHGTPNRPGIATRNPAGDRPAAGSIPDDFAISPPSVSLPKGGGALQGIGEKFQANPATGTASFSIPLPVTPARGKAPEVSLSYNSGSGNGPFGIGWNLSVASIRRKTDRGLPRYIDDGEDADTFVMSGAEDLVPMLNKDNVWSLMTRTWNDGADDWTVTRYRPRIDDAFAVIERFRHTTTGETFWRTITRDNVQRVYGRTSAARVADPDKPTRVFEWLLEEESDELGNVTAYTYVKDSSFATSHIADAGRQLTGNTPTCAFLKRVSYGNSIPYASPARTSSTLPPRTTIGGWTYPSGKDATSGAFRFHLVFDYGDHDTNTPELSPGGTWSSREDPFSTFQSRFDIRCQRLCQRVLLFHDFASVRDDGTGDGTGTSVPAVVRSLEFTYDENKVATRMTSVVQKGWTWVPSGSSGAGSYTTAALPALDFGYSEATIDETVRFVDGLDDLPHGLDTSRWQWVDLDGEGLSGLLTERAGGWYYKRNEGNGTLGAVQRLGSRPNVSLGAPGTRLVDLSGDGKLDVVVMRPDIAGYQERTADGDWEPLRRFPSRPTESVDDPNTRLVDLDGDGIADMLITEGNVFRWYPSKAKEGYETSLHAFQPTDEKKGPRVVFAGSGESIHLADMTGDGLSDIVRIRNGSVCYWPNKGYGQFGARVQMKGSPRFDSRDRFDPARIRLADIDGAGPTDLLYVGPKGVQLWFNQSGNGFSDGTTLDRFPAVSNAESVQVADLRGDGTACLVWASPLIKDAWQPLRYVHLMSEGKPYLLTSITNNRGRETRLTYAPSTQFYLADRQAGTPWATRLAFPVQCLQKVEQVDHVTGWKFSSVYAYHHGYFDGPEREFRGFGLVDQWDTESFSDFEDLDKADSQLEFARAPVRIRTWFHTGAWKDDGTLSEAYSEEYYGGDTSAGSLDTPSMADHPDLSVSRTPRELREAFRALKGRMLRQETYADDASPDEAHPYTVTEQSFRVVRLQAAQGDEGHAIFRVDPQETLTYQYDRNPDDPRVSHQLTLEVDDYGGITRAATLSYPRRDGFGPLIDTLSGNDVIALDEQLALHVVVNTTEVINNDHNLGYKNSPTTSDPNNEVWHVGLPHVQKSEELTGVSYSDTSRATIAGLLDVLDGTSAPAPTSISFETSPTGGTTLELRRISEQRVKYFNDAGTGAATSFGTPGLRAIPYQRYILAITSGLFSDVYGTATSLTMAQLRTKGGYVEFNSDGHAWLISGVLTLDTDAFFVPTSHDDAFGNTTSIQWDADALAVESLTDAVSNVTVSTVDYRTMAPSAVEDPNGTVTVVETDELGRVTATWVYNTDTASAYGDDPTLSTPDDPTTRFTYTTTSTPNSVKVEARDEHGGTATYQESYAYLDGSGAVVQTKSQVAPGDAPEIDAGSVVWNHTTSRWVGSGRIIVDNKGNIVRKYEPFFSHTSDFEDEKDIAEWGVSPVFSYDPIGRNTKVTLPDDNFRTFFYSPWEVQAFDECDNESSGPHENTPTITHLDAMGRVVEVWELLDTDWLDSREDSNPSLRLDPTADDGVLRTRVEFDVSGNPKVVTDPRDNDIQVQTHDLLGRALFTGSADEGYGTTSGHGESRIAPDADGQAFQSWRSGGQFFEVDFDALRRPTHRSFNDGTTTRLVEYRVYGEASGAPDFARGRPWKVYDTAGLHEFSEYDFKGNPIGEERTVVDDLKADVDWTDIDNSSQTATVLAAVLGSSPTAHTLSRTFDALGRQLTETAPDGSITTYSYDEGNRLVTVEVAIGGGSTTTPMVDGITYNARGQRLTVIQGDSSGTHATTTYTYDEDRFWVTDIETQRSPDSTSQLLQDLSYTRDPCGNITQVTDGAHEDHFFDNTQVTPTRTFLYDALYRLIEATGREKKNRASQTWGLPSKGGVPDGGAASTVLEEYTEEYKYDKAGNITELKHIPSTSATWTRTYSYASGNNQLQSTSEPASGGGTRTDSYDYNERGAMVFLPHLDTSSGTDNVVRDFRDHIRRVTIDTSGNKAWYAYDAGGQRIGKHVESPDTRIRLYLWGYELYREYNSSDAVIEEWEVLHVMDDQRRVALVETQTVGGTKQFLRFQFSDHLGTAAIECDGLVSMGVVSYEEFHPYGTVAWYAEKSGVDLNPKRYRFTGMERDDETGMQYHSQRYYLPWLGRWERVDPIGLGDGGNRFAYGHANPVRLGDLEGLAAKELEFSSVDADGILTSATGFEAGDHRRNTAIAEAMSDDGTLSVHVDGQDYKIVGIDRGMVVTGRESNGVVGYNAGLELLRDALEVAKAVIVSEAPIPAWIAQPLVDTASEPLQEGLTAARIPYVTSPEAGAVGEFFAKETYGAVGGAAAGGLSRLGRAQRASSAAATAISSSTEAAALRLPRSVGARANITTTSRIKDSKYATRLADKLSDTAQRDVDSLLEQLRGGNANPGIGTRALGDGFFELRGRNAGRVIVKQVSAGAFDIVGKFQGHVRGSTANSNTIMRLINDYNSRQ